MRSTDYDDAVRRAGESVSIADDDAPRIAEAIHALDERDATIFGEAQRVSLAVHLATFLDRVATGGTLPHIDQETYAQVSSASQRRAASILAGLAGHEVGADEALLVAVHRDAALLTRRSTT